MRILTTKSWQLPIIISILVTSAITVYLQILPVGFLSDDFGEVAMAVHAHNDGFIYSLLPQKNSTGKGFIRPLIKLSYQMDYWLWGLSASGYHFTNIMGHAVNTVLVYWLALLLPQLFAFTTPFSQNHALPAFLAALLFAVTAHHAEAVTWIAGRTDVLVTLFSLLSLIAYSRYLLEFRKKFLILALAAFFLALMTKEMAISLPILVVLLGFFSYSSSPLKIRHLIISIVCFLAIALLYLVGRYVMLNTVIGGYGTDTHVKLDILLLLANVIMFTWKALVPHFLHSSLVIIKTAMPLIHYYLAAVIVLLILAGFGGGFFRFKHPLTKFLAIVLMLFVVSLLPVISLGVSFTDTQSERFLYFPSVFISIAVVYLLISIVRPALFFFFYATIWICCVMDLYLINGHWMVAGELAQQSIKTINTQVGNSKKPILITNLPDNFKGAYVFRNGIYNAVQLFGNSQSKILFFATYNIHNLNEQVIMKHTKSNTTSVFEVTLPKSSRFVKTERKGPVTIQLHHPRKLVIVYPNSENRISVFHHTGAKLEKM